MAQHSLELEDVQKNLLDLQQRVSLLKGPLAIDEKTLRLHELDDRMGEPGFWDNQEKAQAFQKERNTIDGELQKFSHTQKWISDLIELLEMAKEDPSVFSDVAEEINKAAEAVRKLELARMLRGMHDENSAIISVNVGLGGADANEFAEMLLRMYMRYGEKQGFSIELMDVQPADTGGLKSATMMVEGQYAFGFLKAEIGVHRLVRISPFSGKRETSFASVWVLPEINDDVDVDIKPDDLRIDTLRSGGAGGQHVNKTESAVRITHIPTNTVVLCQQERSQIKNRALAMKLLRAKLYDLEVKKRLVERDKAEAAKMEATFGSQIRNYVLAPYRLAKDLRSGHETSNVDGVLDGDLQNFIESYLLHQEDVGQHPGGNGVS